LKCEMDYDRFFGDGKHEKYKLDLG
jgi:hypothetical protein